jgi:hypothetical protein
MCLIGGKRCRGSPPLHQLESWDGSIHPSDSISLQDTTLQRKYTTSLSPLLLEGAWSHIHAHEDVFPLLDSSAGGRKRSLTGKDSTDAITADVSTQTSETASVEIQTRNSAVSNKFLINNSFL